MMLLLILFNSIDESIFCLYGLLSSLLLIMYMMIDGVIYVNNVVVWLQSTTNLVILMKYVQYGRMYIYMHLC